MATFTQADYQHHLNEHQLMAARCRDCGELHLPPRPLCPVCYSQRMEWVELAGSGRLAGFTTIHVAPTAMVEAGYGRDKPYCVGVVKLDEGPSISAQIIGVDASRPAEITVDLAVDVAFIDRGQEEERQTFLAFSPRNL